MVGEVEINDNGFARLNISEFNNITCTFPNLVFTPCIKLLIRKNSNSSQFKFSITVNFIFLR